MEVMALLAFIAIILVLFSCEITYTSDKPKNEYRSFLVSWVSHTKINKQVIFGSFTYDWQIGLIGAKEIGKIKDNIKSQNNDDIDNIIILSISEIKAIEVK